MVEMVKFPYNNLGVARLDSDNIIHNHLYHQCPVGRVDNNGVVHKDLINESPVGRVDSDGFVYLANKEDAIAKVKGSDYLSAGSAYLLLIHGNR